MNGETLTPVTVQTSVNDGTTTAITGGSLQEGAHVVTGVVQTAAATSQQPGGGSPLMPQRPRRTGGAAGGGGR